MHTDYLKTLSRRVYPSLKKTTQTEKSSQAFKHLSFLLEEFNCQNKFLTKQVRDLLHENQVLKDRTKERILASEISRSAVYESLRPNRKQPYIKKQYIGQITKQGGEEGKVKSPRYKTVEKSAVDTSHIMTDRTIVPPVYVPKKYEPQKGAATARTEVQTQPVFMPLTPDNANKTIDTDILHKQIISTNISPIYQKAPENLQPIKEFIVPQTIQPVPIVTPTQSTTIQPAVALPEPVLPQPDTRNSRSRSPGRKGIQVTSKSPSPQSRSKKNTSREKETKEDKPLEINLKSFKTEVQQPKEAAIQVTPSIARQRASSQPRLVSQNIQLKIVPKPVVVVAPPPPIPPQPQILPRQYIRHQIPNPPTKIDEIKKTESLRFMPRQSSQEILPERPVIPPAVLARQTLNSYVVLPAGIPVRFTFNGTMNFQNSNVQTVNHSLPPAPPIIPDNNPRRPRILDEHQRRSADNEKKRFLSLVARDRKRQE